MSTRSRLLLIVLILSAAANVGLAQKKRPRTATGSLPDSSFNRWVEFESTDGKFTILFPGVATMRFMGYDQPVEAPKKYYATYQSSIKYTVMSYEYPENLEAPIIAKDVFDSTRDAGIAASAQAGEQPQVISETEANYEGHPARLLQISMAGGRMTWCKSVVVKNHFYFMEVVCPNPGGRIDASKDYERIAKFFFNSFHVSREIAEFLPRRSLSC